MTGNFDIAAELRARHSNVTGADARITQPIVGATIFLEAAEEIERLRGMLEVQDEMMKHYVLERDQARRSLCVLAANEDHAAARVAARELQWDCFKEDCK